MADKCPLMGWQGDPGMGPNGWNGQNGPNGQYDEEGISLKEILIILIKGKKTIAIVTAIVFVLTVLGAFFIPSLHFGTQGNVQTAVQLYFSGIEDGKTPSGEAYDVNKIKSAEVLQSAVDKIDFGNQEIDIEKLKGNISFQAVVPDSVAKTMENLKDIKTDEIRIEQLNNLNYNPNIYIVNLNLANELGINEEQGRELLDNIVIEYKAQLIDKYEGNVLLADVFADNLVLENYDYIQAANILDDQLNRMQSYVVHQMPQTNIKSSVTGLNPAEISSALQSIRTVDMERIFTFIGTFYITKDPIRAVAIYEQLVEDNIKEAAQYNEQAWALKEAVINFKKEEQTLVFGDLSSEPMTLTSENVQYNNFVSQYIQAGTNASNAREDATYYQGEADRFKIAMPLTRDNSVEAKEVEDNMNLLKDKLVYWTDVINKTAEEYYTGSNYKKYVEQLLPAQVYNKIEEDMSLLKIGGIALIIGLLLGAMLVFFRAYLKEEKEVATDEK